MNTRRFRTIDEFWPYYVREHSKRLTRQLHLIGSLNLLLWMIVAARRRSLFLTIAGIVTSYAFAWFGHFVIEGNRPATLKYPILSALCEMIMIGRMLRGEMEQEVARYVGGEIEVP